MTCTRAIALYTISKGCKTSHSKGSVTAYQADNANVMIALMYHIIITISRIRKLKRKGKPV